MIIADFDLDLLPEPMLLVSAAGRIRAANDAAARMLNRTAQELAQVSLTDLV
jgi:nitrogen-specific signal transduction histidine kinase